MTILRVKEPPTSVESLRGLRACERHRLKPWHGEIRALVTLWAGSTPLGEARGIDVLQEWGARAGEECRIDDGPMFHESVGPVTWSK